MNRFLAINVKILLIIFLCFSHAVSQEEDIFTSPVGSCTGTLEKNDKWNTLTIRLFHPKYNRCGLQENDFNTFLNHAFSKLSEKKSKTEYTSISMGRIIEYPWISKALADSAADDPRWSTETGKLKDITVHEFTAELLNRTQIVNTINEHLKLIGHKISGIRVEKVLISTGKPMNFPSWIDQKTRVPFDAMLWFKLEKIKGENNGKT